MKARFAYWASWAPIPAAALVLAAWAGGFGLDGYSHARHPLALLGARGVDGARVFNLLGWGLPGLLLAIQAIVLRESLSARAGLAARLGAWLMMLSAMAFAAQAAWPIDPLDLESASNRGHALAWMLWWVAYAAGAGVLAAGLRGCGGPAWPVLLLSITALVVIGLVLAMQAGLWAALAGRLAVAAWLAGGLACGALMRRGAGVAPAGAV